MKKLLVSALAIMLLGIMPLKANEGMWLPLLIKRLNEADMQKLGLQLTAEELYSVNNSSLKDAIVNFGNFCTGEVISNRGLILTNHHCGYDAIQTHSSPQNDYLTDGFWAYNLSQEKPTPGLTVTFLIRMEDVTAEVLAALNPNMTEDERAAKVREIGRELTAKATAETHYTAQVKEFFDGNEYYLFVYEVFKDVRLVGAPPSSIGKYGGDTDNWMWPRHTGDFSLFRVYTGPDGKPAEYSEENIPLVPKHHLPISIEGVKNGDFSMIFGYPGSTDRFLTSFGIELALNVKNQLVVDIRAKKLEIMKKHMNASPEVRIQYASKYASTANYWKYFIGQTEQLKRNRVYDKKKMQEAHFTEWMYANEMRKEQYGECLATIEKSYEGITSTQIINTFLNEAVFQGAEVGSMAIQMTAIHKMLQGKESEKSKAMAAGMMAQLEDSYKDYNLALDQEIFAAMLEMYYARVPMDQMPQVLKDIHKKYKGDFKKYAQAAYAKSMFPSKEKMQAFLANPSLKVLEADPIFSLYNGIYSDYVARVAPIRKAAFQMQTKGARTFVAGLREMDKDKKFYPNANFTMRMTYGTVGSYKPADGVKYSFYTTIEGIMQKEDPSNDEFIVPAKLKELYNEKDYGQYANADGELVVNFITNNDITGGNSGSPVINAKGELIGCAFDGNWEAMSGDISFENQVQRTISVDARYILFIIDKYAGAQNLIDEMTIIGGTESANIGSESLDND
jgi:hypothetical protein